LTTKLNPYDYKCCGKDNIEGKRVSLYRFKNIYNENYIAEVFHYENSVYAIKYYLKNHRDSNKRYNITYSKDFLEKKKVNTGALNFFRVMDTVLTIAQKEIISKDNKASFGFLGAPKEIEMNKKKNKKNINNDKTISNTKRYKVYSLYARRYYNPQYFEYIDSKTSSILILRNNKNKDILTPEVIQNYILKEIIPNL